MANDGTLTNGAGHKMLNTELVPIQVPPHRSMKVTDEGEILIEPLGAEPGTQQSVGKIALTSAVDVELKKFRDGEIRVADGSVPPLDDSVYVQSKHLELSNVNITEELINSIEDQRQYEINIKMISSASELDESGASLMRMPT